MRTGSAPRALRALGRSGLAGRRALRVHRAGRRGGFISLVPDSISLVPLGGFRHGGFAEGAARDPRLRSRHAPVGDRAPANPDYYYYYYVGECASSTNLPRSGSSGP
jgi:hypothetical protein